MSEEKLQQLRIDRGAGANPSRRRGGKWVLAAAAIAIACVVIGWQRYGGEAVVETVTVTTAYPYQGVTLLNASGYVVAQRKASVATKATGRLEWLGVQEGSIVKSGQVIARLESSDVRATAAQSAAGVESARAELQDAVVALARTVDLANRKFITTAALDTAQARHDKAKAALAVAQANLRGANVAIEQTLIRAPFDGVILTKSANVGDMVTPFSQATDSKGAVVTMADMETLEVEADVSETNLAKITVGQPCEIALDAYPDQRLRGEVSRLVPTVDRSKASVMTKVKFIDHDRRVLPDMSAKVAFLARAVGADQRKPRTAVHRDAVVSRDGRSVVLVIADGRVRITPVTTGATIGDLVEIEGVKPGDKLVQKPSELIRDGSKVTVAVK
jgi:RND family efflux transporter MFP subunit